MAEEQPIKADLLEHVQKVFSRDWPFAEHERKCVFCREKYMGYFSQSIVCRKCFYSV